MEQTARNLPQSQAQPWYDFFQAVPADDQSAVVEDATTALSDRLSFQDRVGNIDILLPQALEFVNQAVSKRHLNVSRDLAALLAERVIARVGGLEFLQPLLKREDLSEIVLTPDGRLFILLKGDHDFTHHIPDTSGDLNPRSVQRVVDTLLSTSGKAVSEAAMSVDARLPRIAALPGLKGGARVKILHPSIAPGKASYPSINIRLFEPEPVQPQKLVAWNVAPPAVIQALLGYVSQGVRLLIVGGTASGKTTFLSAMCSAIPKTARVVKIEDPEEIWIDHPHVVTIEARRAPHGSTSVRDYTLKDGVDDAMRMSPRWLIVGEVRTGDAGAALFRAQMSDHPGLSTFHAESPEAAVRRMALNMFMDAAIPMTGAKELFAMGVELLVQVGWIQDGGTAGRRALIGVWQVEPELHGGDVRFSLLYKPGDTEMADYIPRHARSGAIRGGV